MFTRWKINSIGYGAQVLAVGGILTIALPLILYLGYSVLRFLGLQLDALLIASSISFAVGIVLLVLFLLLLAVELIQDHWRDGQYLKTRNRKVKISAEFYECQFCGDRQVRESDKRCKSCGQDLI